MLKVETAEILENRTAGLRIFSLVISSVPGVEPGNCTVNLDKMTLVNHRTERQRVIRITSRALLAAVGKSRLGRHRESS